MNTHSNTINQQLATITLQLRLKGMLTSQELQLATGLSQPQISRYLKLLKSDIVKIGKGKSTKYILTRSIPNVGDRVPVFTVGENSDISQIGTIYPVSPKGYYWESTKHKTSKLYDGLPYFLNDLYPSGYLGRLIPRTYPDWQFPEDIRLWSTESVLRYLVNFGVDLIGNFIVGKNAADKYLKQAIAGSSLDNNKDELEYYQALAKQTEELGIPGSSAGGEHPKFVANRLKDGIPVIVKFVRNSNSEVTKRRIDLLQAEHVASEIFKERKQGTNTRLLNGTLYTFLEIERFDRTSHYGRKGVISLYSIDAEFIGSGQNWSSVAQKLLTNKIITKAAAEEVFFREYFGHLIGNTDMHGGNISFFFENEQILEITPSYDMLPMKYTPMQEYLSEEPISIDAPFADTIYLWKEAINLALKYWQLIQKGGDFSATFRKIAKLNEQVIHRHSMN